MVKWCSKWLEQIDANEVAIHLWAKYLDSQYCWCSLCNKKVKYDKSGGQALTRHANIDDHKKLSKLRHTSRSDVNLQDKFLKKLCSLVFDGYAHESWCK